MQKEFLKILMLEDSTADAELIQQFLLREKPACVFKLVMTRDGFLEGLDQFKPDLILSDNTLPQFSATEALELFHERMLDIPFILVTGTVSEEFAVTIIKLGADDYILKDRLVRLPAAINAALQKKKAEAAIKHSEEMKRLIMNSALDAVVCLDMKGFITVWNFRAEQLFGWKEEETLGKELAEIVIPEQYREMYTKGFGQYLETGSHPVLNRVTEMTALKRNGAEFPVEAVIVPVQQAPGGFFCAFIRDITERKKNEESLRLMEKEISDQKIQEQKKISRAIIQAQEAEKNRIGLELHDNISQMLAGTKMFLSHAAKENEAMRATLKYPIELIDNLFEEVRLLSHKQVTPLKNINLEEQVWKLLKNLTQVSTLKLNFSYTVSNELLSDDLKLNIYRLIQEQTNNILKHAGAANAYISIKTEGKNIHIVLADDGKGFTTGTKREGIGISNMMNRVESFNGQMEILSSPGNGCVLNVTIPISI